MNIVRDGRDGWFEAEATGIRIDDANHTFTLKLRHEVTALP